VAVTLEKKRKHTNYNPFYARFTITLCRAIQRRKKKIVCMHEKSIKKKKKKKYEKELVWNLIPR